MLTGEVGMADEPSTKSTVTGRSIPIEIPLSHGSWKRSGHGRGRGPLRYARTSSADTFNLIRSITPGSAGRISAAGTAPLVMREKTSWVKLISRV